MKLKRSPFTIQDKNTRDLDIEKKFPTLADKNSVHRRRDLDSLG